MSILFGSASHRIPVLLEVLPWENGNKGAVDDVAGLVGYYSDLSRRYRRTSYRARGLGEPGMIKRS